MSRWDWVEGIKSETASRVAVRELGKMLVDELSSWPVEVNWCDQRSQQRFAVIFEPGARRPSRQALAECLQLVQWDLSRDNEAISYYERNHHLEKACPEKFDRLACEFLRTYFMEAFFVLLERTSNRVKRSDLLDGIEELQIRLERVLAP